MSGTACSQQRLLLVIEDHDAGEVLCEFFREEGYVAVVAASVEEALTLLETRSFHLILSDFFAFRDAVPYRSVEQLRQVAQPTPVGILTGSHLSAEEVTQLGFACLIRKPFELDDLSATIAACLQTR